MTRRPWEPLDRLVTDCAVDRVQLVDRINRTGVWWIGLALCIEVNSPELFGDYERLGVDAVLLSAHPVDFVSKTKARALAALYNLWIGVAVPRGPPTCWLGTHRASGRDLRGAPSH